MLQLCINSEITYWKIKCTCYGQMLEGDVLSGKKKLNLCKKLHRIQVWTAQLALQSGKVKPGGIVS